MGRHSLVPLLALAVVLFAATSEASCPFKLVPSTHGVSHHRLLLQANCALQFNGQPQTFKACQDMSADMGAPYNLLWSLTDEGNGSSVMSGALDVQSTGWAAFGLPAAPGSGMLGGSAVVVKTNSSAPSGASVDNYYLGGYTPAQVKPPGKLDLISASAAKSGDRLQALFKIRVPGTGNALSATPTATLMALGQLGPGGALRQHADAQGVEGTLNLGAGLPNAAAAPATAPKAAAPAAAAGSPKIAAVQPSAAQTSETASAPASAASAAPAASTGGCTLQLNGKSQDFAQCKDLMDGIRLLWTLTPDQQGGGSLMQAALQCMNGDGWCGWGLPAIPGQMIGASAVIVKSCSTCPTGASANNYLLASKSTAGVQSGTGKLNLASDMAAAKTGDGALATTFTLKLPAGAEAPTASTDCIAAHGTVGADDSLQAHSDAQSVAGTISLASGAAQLSSATTDKEAMAHGVLMTVAWAIILPISIVTAHSMRNTLGPNIWFQIHRALGVVAVVCILVGFGLGVYLWTTIPVEGILLGHVVIGVTTTGLAILQALAIVARPQPDSKHRLLWNYYHHNVGRIAVMAAFANAMIGFKIGGFDWGWYLGLCLIWVLIWLLGGAKSFYDHRRARHAAFLKQSSGGRPTAARAGDTELPSRGNDGKYTML